MEALSLESRSYFSLLEFKKLQSYTVNMVDHLGEAEASVNGQPNALFMPYAYQLGWPFRLASVSAKWPTVFQLRMGIQIKLI
jgi:hypothetical protein